MALDPDQIEAITAGHVQLYRVAEQAMLETVTKYLAAGLDTPTWAADRYAALSTLRGAIDRTLEAVQADAAGSLRQILATAYRAGTAAATTGIPARYLPRDPDRTPRGERVAALVKQVPRVAVVENLAAALVQDVGERHSNVLRHVIDVYRQVIAEATSVSVAAGTTRRQASQWAYQRLVDKGVTSFTDRSGRRWRLSSYVEMAVRTVTQRAAVQGQTDRLTTLGVDTVVVSDSPRECERCRPWEGKILSISGGLLGRVSLPSRVGAGTVMVDIAGSVEQARAAGLQHPNCTHSLRAYLPGVTKRQPAKAAPEEYEAKQRQREIERAIRRYKERETAALTPDAKRAAAAKTRAWQAAMREHLAAHPALKRLPYREQPGAGNVPPADQPLQLPPADPPAPPPLPQRRRTPPLPEPVADEEQPPPWEAQNRRPRIGELIPRTFDEVVERRKQIRDALLDVVDGEYAGFQVDTAVDAVSISDNRLGFMAIIRHPDGGYVGRVERNFYRGSRDGEDPDVLWAEHTYLSIDPRYQGQGFAEAWNHHLERWYQESGFSHIGIHADIDVGGYAWARQGFDFEDGEEAEKCLDRLRNVADKVEARADKIRRWLNNDLDDQDDEEYFDDDDESDVDYPYDDNLTEANRAQLSRLLRELDRETSAARDILDRARTTRWGDDDYPTAWEISDAGRQPGQGRSDLWIGKRAMLGSDWMGVKWL